MSEFQPRGAGVAHIRLFFGNKAGMSREQTQWEEVRAFPECLQPGGNGRSAAVGCRVWYSVGRVKIPVWLLIWIYIVTHKRFLITHPLDH